MSVKFIFLLYFIDLIGMYLRLKKIFWGNPICCASLKIFIILQLVTIFYLIWILLIFYSCIIFIIVLTWLGIIFASHVFVLNFTEIINTLLIIKYLKTIILNFFARYCFQIRLLILLLTIYNNIRYFYFLFAIRKFNSYWSWIKWQVIRYSNRTLSTWLNSFIIF